jgi:hypothetical protein
MTRRYAIAARRLAAAVATQRAGTFSGAFSNSEVVPVP